MDLKSIDLNQNVLESILHLRAQVNRYESIFISEPEKIQDLLRLVNICSISEKPEIITAFNDFINELNEDQKAFFRVLGVDFDKTSEPLSSHDLIEVEKLMKIKSREGIPTV